MNIQQLFESAFVQYQAGNLQRAEQILNKILKIQPDNFEACYYLGGILDDAFRTEEAIRCYRRAMEINPEFPGTYYNIAALLQGERKFDEALAYYQKALGLDPTCADIHNSIGVILQSKGEFGEAVSCYQEALRLDPNFAKAYYNLGNVLVNQGKLQEAESYFRRSLQLKPDELKPYESLLMLMNYGSDYDPAAIFSEHRNFSKQFEYPLRVTRSPHTNRKIPDRKLKIGYVSPDFRRHSVNYFIEPVLASHSHGRFELFCYSDVSVPDNVTERLQGYADQWRNIAGMSDEQVAGMVRKDGIDILVDLAGHTGYNRILLFARKPAPVQVTWLGYPNTTGLSAVDYRIVDAYTDPPGLTDPFYTEKLIRLPESFLCYQPDSDTPAAGDLPALQSGHITFGSFNVFLKVSRKTVALWAAILKALPGSRLLLKTKNFSDKTTCRNAREMFTAQGISPDRLDLLSHNPSFTGHLDTYNRIDIGLDTFPYNGTTTTCEALWMGVPVITLAGNTHASRVGVSLLTTIGLADLIAETGEEYVSTAVKLAGDIKRLRSLRENVRGMMAHSPLTDARRFVSVLETCYREMWEKWCKQ
jgi:protein O-GlcNAc transferase